MSNMDADGLNAHLLGIVQTMAIEEQSELQEILRQRGYDIPQATLSRRLKKLKIAKVGGVYKAIELRANNLPLILNIQISDFGLMVLHTLPGHANALASWFDQKYVAYTPGSAMQTGILGTIAGDDTLLLIVKNEKNLKGVMALLLAEFPYLQSLPIAPSAD